MREARRGKDTDIMPNRETNDKDAAVAEQDGHVALEKTSSKKSAPKARKNAKAVKPEKKGRNQESCQSPAQDRRLANRRQGRQNSGNGWPRKGRHSG